jgi:hypothetical protein
MPWSLTRCGCCAHMDIQLSKQNRIWYVKNYVDLHNHDLAMPEHVYVL